MRGLGAAAEAAAAAAANSGGRRRRISRRRRCDGAELEIGESGRRRGIRPGGARRTQAIIKMDEDEIFFLKNTGKFPIFVNSKEVPPKKRIHLLSSSLVEIKDMSFIFEVNDGAVRRYIKNLQESSQENNTCFEWKPNHN